MFFVDFSFWIAVIGKHCDEGNATRHSIVAELKRQTSLKEKEALRLIDAMLEKGKLVIQNGFHVCTIPL